MRKSLKFSRKYLRRAKEIAPVPKLESKQPRLLYRVTGAVGELDLFRVPTNAKAKACA
jgi:hypothetical protein